MCQGTTEDGIDPAVQLSYQSTNYSGSTTTSSEVDPNAKYHDFRWWTNDSRPAWFQEQMIYMQGNFRKGHIAYPKSTSKRSVRRAIPSQS